MLLALAADPDDIEVLMISVTYGNVDAKKCVYDASLSWIAC